jgi:hypothetical protein
MRGCDPSWLAIQQNASIDAKPPSGSIEAKNGAYSINGALSIMQIV